MTKRHRVRIDTTVTVHRYPIADSIEVDSIKIQQQQQLDKIEKLNESKAQKK